MVKVRHSRKKTAAKLHPLIAQADVPAAQRARHSYEIVRVPNPHGEVVVRGEVLRHDAVRRKPAYKELHERRVFERARIPSRQIMAALEWLDEQMGLAGSGMVKCGLDISGGGASGSPALPVSHWAMQARSEVAWARGLIGSDLLPAFDAVMMHGERFAEAARRLHANRHVRASVERTRKRLAQQFVEAAAAFAEAWAERFVPQRTGRIIRVDW